MSVFKVVAWVVFVAICIAVIIWAVSGKREAREREPDRISWARSSASTPSSATGDGAIRTWVLR
jgi:hypothetical protein